MNAVSVSDAAVEARISIFIISNLRRIQNAKKIFEDINVTSITVSAIFFIFGHILRNICVNIARICDVKVNVFANEFILISLFTESKVFASTEEIRINERASGATKISLNKTSIEFCPKISPKMIYRLFIPALSLVFIAIVQRRFTFDNFSKEAIWINRLGNANGFTMAPEIKKLAPGASAGYPTPDAIWKGRFWPKRDCDAEISIISRLYSGENKIDIPICRTVEMANELIHQLRENEIIFPRRL